MGWNHQLVLLCFPNAANLLLHAKTIPWQVSQVLNKMLTLEDHLRKTFYWEWCGCQEKAVQIWILHDICNDISWYLIFANIPATFNQFWFPPKKRCFGDWGSCCPERFFSRPAAHSTQSQRCPLCGRRFCCNWLMLLEFSLNGFLAIREKFAKLLVFVSRLKATRHDDQIE